jgi:hypothetical protein
MSPNPHEDTARSRKVFALVEAIDRVCRKANLDTYADAEEIAGMLENWDATAWAELAISHGIRPPSETTRHMVIERVRARAQYVDPPADYDVAFDMGEEARDQYDRAYEERRLRTELERIILEVANSDHTVTRIVDNGDGTEDVISLIDGRELERYSRISPDRTVPPKRIT